MSKFPIATRQRPQDLRRRAASPVEVVDAEWTRPAVARTGSFRFHYSYTEISSQGGRTQLKSRSARFEDGRLATERLDAELDPELFDQAAGRLQQQLVDHTASLLRALTWWLPAARRTRGGD